MGNTARQDCSINQKEWKKICTIAATCLGDEVYKKFLSHCRFENSIKNTAIIKAPTRIIKEHLEVAYKQKLETLWHELNEDIHSIEIQVGHQSKTLHENGKENAKIIQLPLWPEAVRGTPNAALRGALFSAIIPNKRKALYRAVIADEKDLKIKFSGWQLDQADRDVWEQALHMARQQPLGEDIYFSARSFLKALGRGTGKTQHEWLNGAFSRLIGCGVEITHNGYTYGGSLLSFEREEETQRYKLSIDSKMMKLYTAGWTQNDFEERKKIGNKKFLALWLHGYISSHAKTYPTKVETFLRLSGSSNSCVRGFKRHLKNALVHLKEINLLKDFHFENDLVHIKKYPSDSQKRHLRNQD